MSLIASDKGNFSPVPAGNHPAICYQVVDFGVQRGGKFPAPKHQIRINWEIPSERIVINGEDLPRAIGRTFTLSLNAKANLGKALESWRGKPFTAEERVAFDVKRLLGAAAMVNVVHVQSNGKTYANVSSISPLPKMLQSSIGKPENPMVYWEIEQIAETGTITDKIPEWMRDVIKQSDEWKAFVGDHIDESGPAPREAVSSDESEVPF